MTCNDEDCGYRHCVICAGHLDASELATCVPCLARVRRDLIAVHDLVRLLPDQALSSSNRGKPAGAEPIPGGDAIVMLGRGSEGLSETGDTNTGDPEPPAWVLGWWEDKWREALGLVPNLKPLWRRRADRVIGSAVAFLDWHLGWAAGNHAGFDRFATDVRGLRTHLEALLHAGEAPAEGVACFECSATLERLYRAPRPCDCPPRSSVGVAGIPLWDLIHRDHDQGGLKDPDPDAGWACPRCRREYSAGEYRLAVQASYDQAAEWRTQGDASRLTGAKRGTIQAWASRGLIRRQKDGSGRTTYNLADIRARMVERAGDTPAPAESS